MLRLLLLALFIALVVAVKLLPWWATAGGLLLIAVLGKLFAGRLVTSALSAPFRAKGKVLAGATVEVHEIAAASPPRPERPDGDDAGDDDAEATAATADRWFRIDLTVRPKPATGPFTLWEPGELELVDARTVSDEPGDGAIAIAELELDHDGTFREDEGEKVPGSLRLRLKAGVAKDVTRLRLRYYFETLGEIPLPS